jgi:hypothetical protein
MRCSTLHRCSHLLKIKMRPRGSHERRLIHKACLQLLAGSLTFVRSDTASGTALDHRVSHARAGEDAPLC